MKQHSITIRIDEHLKNKIENVQSRMNSVAMSQIIRLLLYSSLDNWNDLEDNEVLEEVSRIRSEECKRFYDSN